MSKNHYISRALKTSIKDSHEFYSRLRFFHIDIGKVGSWGRPLDESKRPRYPLYSQYIFEVLSKNEIENIDTIFIDGRFRVACVISTLLHCKAQSTIIIHDFFNRPKYHVVLDFLDIIEQIRTLGVFRPKAHIDKNALESMLAAYQYDAD